jgi:signal transduction histidine kinase/ligand-binding sensor domain-containing protein
MPIYLKLSSCAYLFACLFLLAASVAGDISVGQAGGRATPRTGIVPSPWSYRIFESETDADIGEIREAVEADGRVWAAGQQGVAVYDGYAWRNYGVGENGIPGLNNAILVDRRGRVWIGSESGLFRRDVGDSHWKRVAVDSSKVGGAVTSLAESDEGVIWAGFGKMPYMEAGHLGGLVRIWGDTSIYVSGRRRQEDQINGLHAAHGKLYVCTDSGLRVMDGEARQRFNVCTILSHPHDACGANRVSAVMADSTGLWLGTDLGVVWIGKAGDAKHHLIEEAERPVRSICKTSDGRIWAYSLATLFAWDPFRATFVPTDPRVEVEGTKPYFRATVYGDVLWLAGYAIGRFRSAPTKFMSFDDVKGSPELLGGKLWFGTSAGRATYDSVARQWIEENSTSPVFEVGGRAWSVSDGYLTSEDREGNVLSHIRFAELFSAVEHSNELLFVGRNVDGEVWSYDNKEFTQVQTPFRIDEIRKVVSGDNAVWVLPKLGGQRSQAPGLWRFREGSWSHINFQTVSGGDPDLESRGPDSSRVDRVYDLATRGLEVWAGTWNGLWYFDGNVWALERDPEGPGRRKVTRIVATEEQIWVACGEKGFVPRDGGVYSKTESGWKRFLGGPKPTSTDVWDILPDDDRVWVATSAGVIRVDEHDPPVHITDRNGLARKDTRFVAKDSGGELWFGRGYAPHEWWLTRYIVDKNPPETLSLGPDRLEISSERVQIAWSGSDLWNDTPQGELTYSWRVDDGNWTSFLRNTSTQVSGLDFGAHRVDIRARDEDGNIDPSPATVIIVRVPVLWETLWFQIGLVIGVIAISLQTGRVWLRGRELSEANKTLARRGDELVSLIEDRQKLDAQLEHLQYLDKLRSSLAQTQTPHETVQTAAECLLAVLDGIPTTGITIGYEARLERFGAIGESTRSYRRSFHWGGRERGHLELHCNVELTESQERALLDETAGQISRVLESQELGMQLLQSARLVSLGQMAAGVAHELNQPIGGVSATAEDFYLRIQDGLEISRDQWREMLRRILNMVERMSETVDHLRVFSRDTSDEPGVPSDLNRVINESLGMIRTQLQNHGITLLLVLSEEIPRFRGHPRQVEQVFLNLLSNARDAVDERGDSSDSTYEKRITIRTRSSGVRSSPRSRIMG